MVTRRHNLPVQPTPLIGREREVGAARELLMRDEVRLVTLTGPGGTGKTRVGIEVAAGLPDAFADGVVFVGLAPIRDPGLVIPTIAQAVGVHDAGSRPVGETLAEYLRERHLLLLLDNVEQVLPAAPAIAELLAACPCLKVLATSRASLHVRGEREYSIPPLPLPAAGARSSAGDLANNPAVALFVQRVLDVRPEFVLTDEDAPVVAEICARLDGLPLAIELAAARVKVLSPEALLSRLERRLPLLTGGPRDAPERQRTLRDTIAWSHGLLDEAERRLFRRLAVFVGGCTLEAAEAVCRGGERDEGRGTSGTDPASALDLVASLVDKSLLRQGDGPGGEPRFSMLETVQEFALEQLQAAGEETEVRNRHLSWCVELAETGQEGMLGPKGAVWCDRVAVEHDNMRSALTWSLTDADPAKGSSALRLCAALFQFWFMRDHLAEGRRWLDAALDADRQRHRHDDRAGDESDGTADADGPVSVARPGPFGAHPRVVAFNTLGTLQQQLGNLDEGRRSAEQALALARAVGDHLGVGHSLNQLGVIARSAGAYEQSVSLLEESASIFVELQDPHGCWRSFCNLGETRLRMGDLKAARPLVERGLAAAQAVGYLWGTAQAQRMLGVILHRLGDTDRAIVALEHSLDGFATVRASHGRNWTLLDLGQAHLTARHPEAAAQRFRESLELCYAGGDRYSVARCLEGVGGSVTMATAHARGARWADAARLLGAAAALRQAINFAVAPVERPAIDRAAEAARTALGEDAYEMLLAEGGTLALSQAVELGIDLAQQVSAQTSMQASQKPVATGERHGRGAALTAREREVAVLVGRGYSNRRIAEALVIAEKTAEVHARNVRVKLGLASRAQIAAWAARQGLLGPEV